MSRPDHSMDAYEFGSRSYMLKSHHSAMYLGSPTIVSGVELHQQTADLATIGVVDSEQDLPDEYTSNLPPIPIDRQAPRLLPDLYSDALSLTPLIDRSKKWYASQDKASAPDLEAASLPLPAPPNTVFRFPLKVLLLLPAVFLGTLLNVLDGLSYGMIMFPIGEALFSQMAPAGLSMFYISTVISQLVYSLGGSAFAAGIGSEMIEVTPFFHSMAMSIAANMAGQSDEAVLATAITTYGLSSVVTGVVFLLLGKLRLGSLVGFFPRHILVGCIGGVGYFLVITGIEVLSRLKGGIFYNLETFHLLFGNHLTLLQWTFPMGLTFVLILLQRKIHHLLLVPVFFIAVFFLFHLVVFVVSPWDLGQARHYGWVFPAVQNKEPWYSHYQLFRLNLVDWWALAREFPSMLALTFFGILHVPINVPALAVSVGMDDCDVDRELVAHGISNALSGMVGSIQNYLVYTNSVLFLRAGANDRLAGILLAIATAGIMVAGPVVIGFIPVCLVASLIYLLGYELLKESVWDTWGRLRSFEYATIIIIVVVMGAWDFVYGILAGILLACVSFVVEAARRPVVQDIYTGVAARSTVLRHPKQQEFLKDVGNQICVIRLQGTVFFGSIGGVEKSIREIFEKTRFRENPIKYLIIDMKGVFSLDFSAAEGFRRFLNLTNDFNTQLIISSVTDNSDIVIALRDAGLWDLQQGLEIQLFESLNYALEWCENSFLKTYITLQRTEVGEAAQIRRGFVKSPPPKASAPQGFDLAFGTPRTAQVFQAATRSVRDEQKMQKRLSSNVSLTSKKQPLPLIMITFGCLSDKNEAFWAKLAPFLQRDKIPEDMTFYDTSSNEPSFFLLESGLVRSVFKFESDDREIRSSILPNTAFGDLLESSENRSVTYSTVTASVAWRLTAAMAKELVKAKDGQDVYNELIIVQARVLSERFDTLSANLLISS